MTPTQLAELITETDTDSIDERQQVVVITARLTDEDNRNKWLEIVAKNPAFLTDAKIGYAESDEEYNGKEAPGDEDVFNIVLTKIQNEQGLLLLFEASLEKHASILPNVERVRIADFLPTKTFVTYRAIFELWDIETSIDFEPHGLLPNPREYVVELSVENEVPSDIRPWLLLTQPDTVSIAFNHWSKLARKPLIACISERVSSIDDSVVYHFTGPPSCSFSITDEQLERIEQWLLKGAGWVYTNESRDADVRHLLLANEWARSFRRTNIEELGQQSLDAAQAAYKAYIKSQSRDTLKALSDLRKIVLEETQNVSNRANEFAKSMWKDLAVAATPFVVKILSDAAKAENEAISIWLAYGAAAFLTMSITIQIYLNERWISQQAFARGIWKLEINTALTESELKEVSEQPVAKAIRDFRRVKWVVTIFYLFLILLLINYATKGGVVDITQTTLEKVLVF